MKFERQSRRVAVEIEVVITTVLDSLAGTIVDLSEHGARLEGCGLATGTRFQIEYKGQTVFAVCRWAEVDRMGIRFTFPITEGPLYDELALARRKTQHLLIAPTERTMQTAGAGHASAQPRTFGRAGVSSFGRRSK